MKEVQIAAKQAFELVRARVLILTFGSAVVGRKSCVAMLEKHAPNMRLSSAAEPDSESALLVISTRAAAEG
jgi:hypothetical protein